MNFWRRRLTSMLSLIFPFALLAEASVLQFRNPEQEGTFSNMQVYDGNIYIGAGNSIHVLNSSNLERLKTARVCENNCANAFNKVLLINSNNASKKLLECGTNNNGTCRIRDISNLEVIAESDSDHELKWGSYLIVPTKESRPVSFFLDAESDVLYTGVTYGSTKMEKKNSDFYLFYLASFNLKGNIFDNTKYLTLVPNRNFREYLVYFKSSFQANGFIYFVTNQKFDMTETQYVSKIIRVCQNDTKFWSYTDIVIQCRNGGKTYDFVQDISVFTPGLDLMESLNLNTTDLIVAATFTDGLNPDTQRLSSAICLFKLQDIDAKIVDAKKSQLLCPLSTEHYYLPVPSYCLADNASIDFVLCNDGWTTYKYIIGDRSTTVTATPLYTFSSLNSGYLGKIESVTVYQYTILFAGTSMGTRIQLTIHGKNSEVYASEKTVDTGYPITGIHIEPGGRVEYIMSNRTVVRFETEDCRMYRTCEDITTNINPLCGWCVYENRSTFKNNISCPYHFMEGHWLSPFTGCMSINAEPKGVAVQHQKTLTITVKDWLPDAVANDSYKCVFMVENTILAEISAKKDTDGPTLSCETPGMQSHTDATLQIFVNHRNVPILLAETDFLFFDCGYYNKCSSCTEDNRAECSWCTADTVCESESSARCLKVNKTQLCPKFDNNSDIHYLPHGITKSLSFRVSNLVKTEGINRTVYICSLNGIKVKALTANEGRITCNLTVSWEKSAGIEEHKMEILYGTSMLDGFNTVIVYNCEVLGFDCSICGSLNPLYNCDWCSKPDTNNACQYKQTGCEALSCPQPSIERVVVFSVLIYRSSYKTEKLLSIKEG